MFNKLSVCPVCGQQMEKGFSARASGLSWILPEQFRDAIFLDKDLNEAGLKKFLPSKAAYNLSYHCCRCKIYIVDYSKSYSRQEANELAASILNEGLYMEATGRIIEPF